MSMAATSLAGVLACPLCGDDGVAQGGSSAIWIVVVGLALMLVVRARKAATRR
jgi:hypothetical protein